MTYQLGIDLGTTYSAAAVRRPDAPAEIVPLPTGSSTDTAFVPSVALLTPDGSLLIGERAERLAPAEPGRVVRQFKRRIGDGTPLWLGGTAMTADEVAARFVAGIVDLVSARLRAAPSRVALAHPAGWGPHRLVSLRSALTARGLGDVLFVPEPQAAVLAAVRPGAGAAGRPDPGAAVAVYDFGAGSLDAAVVRQLAPDRFTILGRPEELELDSDFDEAVFEHVRSQLGAAWDALDPSDPAVLARVVRLRRDCVAAKETLSADTDVQIPVSLPGIDTRVRLTRAEFEEMIRPAVAETVEALGRAIASAGLAPNELAMVLLAGGSSRIPLVTQEVSARLGRPVTVAPRGIVAMGAAEAASERAPAPAPAAPATMIVAPSWTPQPAASTSPPPAPLPRVPPSPVAANGNRRHRLIVTAAATAVAAMLVAGGVALAGRPDPAGAGTDPGTDVTTSVSEPPAGETGVVSTTTTTTTPPPPTSATPRSSQRANPPPPPPRRTTSTTTVAPTQTTTVAPTQTSTTTTTPTSSSTAQATSEAAASSEAGAP
ncbi:MAG TPA: Hsp70 family protein [Pseudonocardiaceae bacterium]|nr:Hsp70 family protein [Pseudonocardiaceae bacterium]